MTTLSILRSAAVLAPLLSALAGCGAGGADDDDAPRPEGAASASTPEAARAALEILDQGGNAVDAAVAASLVQAVTDPAHAGLGGWGVALLRLPGRDPVVVDVPTEGTVTGGMAPPTLVRLLAHLWRDHGSGTVGWEDVLAPATRAAADGFPLSRYAHRILVREFDRIEGDSVAAAMLLTRSRAIPSEGTWTRNPDLAATLRDLARDGPDAFYQGAIAARIAAAFGAGAVDDGSVRGAETGLPGVPQARERPAVRQSSLGATVWVAPEPWGGPELLRALAVLDRAPRDVLGGSDPVPRTHWLAEALAYAWGGASSVGAHLATVPPLPTAPVDTSSGRAPARRTRPGTRPDSGGTGGAIASAEDESGETAHLSVIDQSGIAVALTQTLGRPYGTGRAVGSLGFFAGEADIPVAPVTGGAMLGPATDSAAGGPTPADSAGASHRVRAWLSPVLVTTGDTGWVALGSPGGRPAISALAQVLAAWLVGGDSLEAAVEAPRAHVGADGQLRGRLYLEGVVSDPADTTGLASVPDAWGRGAVAVAALRGFRPGERDTGLLTDGLEPWFGGVAAAGRLGESWVVAADPRRDGAGMILVDGRVPPPAVSPPGEGEPGPPLPGG